MPYVKVRPDRDEHGQRLYLVVLTRGTGSSKELLLSHHNPKVPKEGFWLFEAHTLKDNDTRRMDSQERSIKMQKAGQIGLPKTKPGKQR